MRCLLLLILLVLGIGSSAASLHRSSFPPGFVFGTASSAYQYEGAANVDGRGPSIWDTYTHSHPNKIDDRSNGDVAIDSYHRYKEDVNIMKEMNLDAYRFSISWTRILPNGSVSGGINRQGVQYYNNLINELISKGMKPYVTIFHFDSPQALEDKYGGFLSHHIVDDFRRYAEVCFRELGDRVKHWITINEPWTLSNYGYSEGQMAPGRCSHWMAKNCSAGDSGREPYIVAHHLLLAHAAAAKLYRDKYQASQKGKIGITLATTWFIPYSNTKSDLDAAGRALDFNYGWFMDPLTQGDYPFSMRAVLRDRLPKFTLNDSNMVKGSFDFIGINYYTSSYAHSLPISNSADASYFKDQCTNLTGERNGILIGPKMVPKLTNWQYRSNRYNFTDTSQGASSWLHIYPQGIKDLLLYTKAKYNNPVIYITENGIDEAANVTLSLEDALKDHARIEYYHQHLVNIRRAIRKGADVKGYFAWSLLDNFEWGNGYTVRFGINYVDYKDGLKRYPKSSAVWFRKFLKA